MHPRMGRVLGSFEYATRRGAERGIALRPVPSVHGLLVGVSGRFLSRTKNVDSIGAHQQLSFHHACAGTEIPGRRWLTGYWPR
jgi:hypothetical protein